MRINQRQQASNTMLVSIYLPLNSFGLILRCLKLVNPLLDPRWGSPDLQTCSKKKSPLHDCVIYFDKRSERFQAQWEKAEQKKMGAQAQNKKDR